jgi:hypothetical protein
MSVDIAGFFFSKIILFLHFHIDQHKAQTFVCILALVLLSIPFGQFRNIFVVLTGVGMLLVKKTMRQMSYNGYERAKKMINAFL